MLDLQLSIENEGTIYVPLLEGSLSVEWEREGSPGKLSFSVVNDGKINFQEGNVVRLFVDGVPFFYGYVFTKKRDKNQRIEVTCYDQLRYLKNKGSLKYTNQTIGQILRRLADEYGLECGEIEETGVALSRREDKVTLFDMIGNALEETQQINRTLYVLYDDFGKLTLKKAQDMQLDCLICDSTAEDFSYESSIDGETYNSIRLYYENDQTGNLQEYLARDEGNVARWGLLQMYDAVDAPELLKNKAEGYLALYNSKRRKLSVSGAFGDVRVRAGCLVPVQLVLGDVDASTYLLVEQVTHTFENGRHAMDLTLYGGIFV